MRFNLIIVLTVFLISCSKSQRDDCITSLGSNTSEDRIIEEAFDKVWVGDRIKLLLVQDTARVGEVEVTAPSGLIEQLTSVVEEDGRLYLRNENTCNFVRSFNYELLVTLYVDQLSEIKIESIAEVNTKGVLDIKNQLTIYNFAISESKLELSGESALIETGNSATMILSGKLNNLRANIEELSELLAEELECKEAILDTHSPLDCTLNATNGIYAKIYSSGNILYVEEPADYKLVGDQVGTGQLRKK